MSERSYHALSGKHFVELLQTNEHKPGPWWAKCSEPERPGDGWTVYVWDCDACVIGLAVDAQRNPEQLSDTYDGDTGKRLDESLDLPSCLSAANEWRIDEGLQPVGQGH